MSRNEIFLYICFQHYRKIQPNSFWTEVSLFYQVKRAPSPHWSTINSFKQVESNSPKPLWFVFFSHFWFGWSKSSIHRVRGENIPTLHGLFIHRRWPTVSAASLHSCPDWIPCLYITSVLCHSAMRKLSTELQRCQLYGSKLKQTTSRQQLVVTVICRAATINQLVS